MAVERLTERDECAYELEELARRLERLGVRFRELLGASGELVLAEARAGLLGTAGRVAPKLVARSLGQA